MIFGFALLLTAVIATAQDSPMFRGNAEHTGVYPGSNKTAPLNVKWKFEAKGRIIGSPAVAGGAVYFGSADQYFYAVDQNTGAEKWKFPTEGIITSSAAVADGTVYFGSYDGNFYALNAADGKLKWKFATGGERRYAAKHIHGIDPPAETMPDYWDFYLSSPVVVNGIVYFGSGDTNIYALNASDGSVKWKFKTGEVVHSSPAFHDGVIFVGGFDTYFYAIDATTGKERWKFKTPEDHEIHNQEGITSSPAVMDGVVYFGCRFAMLYALDEKTGKQRWAHPGNRGWVSMSPAVHDGKVYLASGSDKKFDILDARSGQSLFSATLSGGVFSSPVIVGDTALLATFDDKVHAFDLKANKESVVFSSTTPEEAAERAARPKLNDVNGFYDERVAAMVGRMRDGIFLSTPAVVDDVVFIGSTNGTMYALQ
ncbi:MAG: PQQ-binding-like beta-propeller repeat protein [Acidobacteriaceae bacterium]|nr:PQQ-binding-like beta-propeller repeat protein [Acidobacteriaceae bacterium]